MFAPDTACDREARGPISINLPVYKLERAADVSDFTEKEIRNGKGKEGGGKHGARNSLDEDSLHSARVQTVFSTRRTAAARCLLHAMYRKF